MTGTALIQYGMGEFKDRCVGLCRVFLEESADLARETNDDFDSIV